MIEQLLYLVVTLLKHLKYGKLVSGFEVKWLTSSAEENKITVSFSDKEECQQNGITKPDGSIVSIQL